MKKICDEKNVRYLAPIIDVSTRWNSTYDMLVRAFEQRNIMSDVLYANKDDTLIKLLLKVSLGTSPDSTRRLDSKWLYFKDST